MLDRNIRKLDYILVSHFDSDHCLNLLEVVEKLKVKSVIISKQIENTELFQEFITLCKAKKVNIIIATAGQVIILEKDIVLKILWPCKEEKIGTMNNNSIVVKLEYKDFSMLFTGDIEKEIEEKLLQKYNEQTLKSTILKVAHHGSATSSTEKIIRKILPKISVIGVGKNNKFNHPNNKVIETLNTYGSKIYRTDLNGEIIITVDKQGKIKIKSMNM